MAENYVVLIQGIEALDDLTTLDDSIMESARLAVNDTTRRARTRAAEMIGQQLGFPSGYLAPSAGRLTIKKFATGEDLEGVILARGRPTSLSRFTRGGSVGRPKAGAILGVNLAVHPGLAKFMKGAFLINLPAGRSEGLGNLGLAIRLRGRPLRNKRVELKQIDKGLFVLYGPSVAQALGGDPTRSVAMELGPELSEFLLKEFLRQQERKNK